MSAVRVELQIVDKSKLLSRFKVIGELKKHFLNLAFVRYIYFDKTDNKIKGVNPPDVTPLVAEAYITVNGKLEDVIKFAKLATET